MTVYDTPEKRAKRLWQLRRAELDRLMALYRKKQDAGDRAGAMKIAWIISREFDIEGEHTFMMGFPQE